MGGKINVVCANCGKHIIRSKNIKDCTHFCSSKCRKEYNYSLKIEDWKKNPSKYNRILNPRMIKKYIMEKQDNKCDVCGMDNIWNNKPIIFILDHIDGDASNNLENNLRCICPNCDSQLDTYKSKNKNSARSNREYFVKKN